MILLKLLKHPQHSRTHSPFLVLKLLILFYCYKYVKTTKLFMKNTPTTLFHSTLLTSPKCHKIGQFNIVLHTDHTHILISQHNLHNLNFFHIFINIFQINYYHISRIIWYYPLFIQTQFFREF